MITSIDHLHATELDGISQILDNNPIICEWVLQDLAHKIKNIGSGAEGMSAEQVIRAAIIKQMKEYSYEDLAFHLLDSVCYRGLCRIGIADKVFQKSVLCNNIKAITSETWEAINRILVAYGQDAYIEKGKEVRIDCTVVSSNIHKPRGSNQLWDGVWFIFRRYVRLND